MGARSALVRAEDTMNTRSPETDEQLMARLGGGDEQALAELVRRYQNDVFRFCLHYLKNVETARELTQETFLRIYAARDRFDVDRSFKPWMLCIARNLSLNELKKKRAVRMESIEEYASSARDDDGGLALAAGDGPAEKAIAQERAAAILDVLKTLPLEAQEIVSLRFFDRRSAREIAEIIESTEGAVRTRLHRILRQLRNECKDLLE